MRVNFSKLGFFTVSTFVLATVLLTRMPAYAGSGAWNYDNNATWSTAARWTPAVVPGTAAGDAVCLTNNITANRTVTIDTTSRTVGSLLFGDVASPYFNFTLAASGGATLTFDNGGIGADLMQVNNVFTSDTVSAPLVLADNLSVTNRGSLTLSGAVSGAGKSITKNGAGILTLTGANTYSGGTVVNNGVLTFLKTSSKPSADSTTVANAGTLGLGIGGAGTFSVADVEALFANALPNVSLSANSAVGVDTTLGSYTYASAVPAGTRGLAKFGNNNLILPVANTYSGPTRVCGGVLELEHANALPGGIGTTGGSSALIFNGGVVGLGVGDFTRSLASATTATGVNFTGPGGWAAFNADRVVNVGGSGATIAWGTANTGFNGQRLLLGAPTATHTLELQNPLNLGTSSSTRTVQVDDGAAAIDAVISAQISGTSGSANLYKSGAGTLALTAVNTYAGQTWLNGGGTLLMTGSASIGTAGSNTLTLGQQYVGAGTLQYDSSATSYFSTVNISQSNAATGTLNQTAGVISVSGNVSLSPTADCSSFLNLSGGALAVGGTLAVGLRGNGAGTLTLSGTGILTAGVVVVPDFSNIIGNYKPSYGQFIQNGGAATVGTLVIAKTSADTNPHVGTFDLNGGTFSAASITGGVATVAGGVNTSTFNFNGGTLKPTASSATFMQGLTAAHVKDGGAVIDTDGYDITVAQPLLHAAGATASPLTKNGAGNLTLTGTNTLLGPVTVIAGTLTLAGDAQLGAGSLAAAITNNGELVFAGNADQTLGGTLSGSGTLTKVGAGTLTLSGATPYAGDTLISAGKLAVVSGGSLSNSAVSLGAGTTLALKVVANEDPWSCKSLALGGGAVTADFLFRGASPSVTVAPLRVNGDVVNNGTLNVTLGGAAVATGTYPLIRYTGELTGSGSLGSVTLPNGGLGTLVDNAANKTIDLSVTTAVSPLVWSGDSGDWDIGVTPNWTGFRSTYLEGDLVLFDDSSSGDGPFTVTLPASVTPSGMFFNNTTKAYTLVGPGALSGDAGICKSGAGGVTLSGPNTSSGGLILDSGAGTVTATLDATQDGLGSGPVALGAGSTLILDNANTTGATVAKANVFGGSGLLKVAFDANTTGRATALSGLSGFAGSVQVGSAGSSTGDKLDVRGADAPDATVQVSDGHTLLVGSGGAPVRFAGVAVRGSGNAEARGALRMAANASSLEAPITLLGDTTIASDFAGATLSGAVTGTAATGATNVLTQGSAASAAGCVLSGAITDGLNGGRVALTQSKGILTLSGSNTYSGGTTINGNGTLRLGANDALPVSGAVVLGGTNGVGNGVGNLALGSFSQTLDSLSAVSMGTSYNTLTVAPGQALTVSGAAGLFVGIDAGVGSETRVRMAGGGALALTHASANVTLGKGQSDESGTGTGVLDLSDLSSVTLGSGAAPINEVRVSYGQMSSGTLTLSNTSNLLAATALNVGNSLQLNAGTGTLVLGAGVNTLAVDTVNIGLYKGVGTVKFASQGAGSSGTATIGGRTKGTTDFVIGSKGGMASGAVPRGTLDLRGHVADIAAGTVTIGREDNRSASIYTGGAAGALYFDGGSFSVSNLVMAFKSGVNTGVNAKVTATLTVSGGAFTVTEGGAFTLATQTGTGVAYATNSILGGTFRSYADILTGPSNCTGVIILDGGTLDMTRHAIGSNAETVTVFSAQSGTLMNLGEFNDGAPIVKTGSGTLTLDGTNTYAGATIVSNGTLRLASTTCLPPTTDLYLVGGTAAQLDYDGKLPVHALYVDGVRKQGSLYGQSNLSPHLSGTGFLELVSQGTVLLLR
jgi:autotransporter-associated beta strand protein